MTDPVNSKLSLEILDDLDSQRFQQNVAREFSKQQNTGIIKGCISGDKVLIGEFKWRVSHRLGVEAKGFIIIEQGSTSSLVCEMTNMTTTTSEITFSGDPTSFTLFFY